MHKLLNAETSRRRRPRYLREENRQTPRHQLAQCAQGKAYQALETGIAEAAELRGFPR